jgi:hypothetical protein
VLAFVDHQASEAVADGSANAVSKARDPAVSGVHLDGELPAPLGGHAALQAFRDPGNKGAVVLEDLRAVFDLDAAPLAQEFVVGTLVDILEPAPATDVVDEDVVEVGSARLHIFDQFDETRTSIDPEAAAAFIAIRADDRERVRLGIGCNSRHLVRDRVALELPRHSNVLRSTARSGPPRQACPFGNNEPVTHAPLLPLRRYLRVQLHLPRSG